MKTNFGGTLTHPILKMLVLAAWLGVSISSLADVWIQKWNYPFTPRPSGTVIDVYDTWDSFDAAMRSVGQNTVVHIGPGNFLTRGLYRGGDRPDGYLYGFFPQSGCTITGSGTNAAPAGTVLQLVDATNNGGPVYGNIVIGNNVNVIADSATGISVSNLQIDCNGYTISQTLHPGENVTIQAVELRGQDNFTIANVLAINAIGRDFRPDGVESFIITLIAQPGSSVNNAIENCTVDCRFPNNPDFSMGKCSAISLNRFDVDGGYMSGTVTGCHVYLQGFNTPSVEYGSQFAYNGERMRNCTFSSNYAYGAHRGYNNDSRWFECCTFSDNKFDVPNQGNGICFGFYLINGGRHSVLSGNTIRLSSSSNTGIFVSGATYGNPPYAPEGLGASEWLISGNTITNVPGSPTISPLAFDLNNAGGFTVSTNIDIENNWIQPNFRNNFPGSYLGWLTGNSPTSVFPPQPHQSGWHYSEMNTCPQWPQMYTDSIIYNRGDFNSDGRQDLICQDGSTSNLKTWLVDLNNGVSLDSTTLGSINPSNASGYTVVACADLNLDQEADLWMTYPCYQGYSAVGYWLMNNGAKTTGSFLYDSNNNPVLLPDGWRVVGCADFGTSSQNSAPDGYSDILLQYTPDGTLGVWFIHGTTFGDAVALTPSGYGFTWWRAVGTGDFNRDGYADILFQDTESNPDWNGALAVWLMQGTTQLGYPSNPQTPVLVPSCLPPSSTWKVAAVADFNNDNWVDIIFQDQPWGSPSGNLYWWLLNGVRALDCFSVPPPLDYFSVPPPSGDSMGAYHVVGPK
jgi:hypothetical protein